MSIPYIHVVIADFFAQTNRSKQDVYLLLLNINALFIAVQ